MSGDPWEITVGGDGGLAEGVAMAPPPRVARPPRVRLPASAQQRAFYDELVGGTSNILLEARAGTGKSTSCREGMWRILDARPGAVIRYCCFNKAIATEFEEKCPPACEVGTMHRFGLLALREAFESQLEKDKTYLVLDGIEGGDGLKRYHRKAISQVVSLAKNHGLSPAAGEDSLVEDMIDLVDHYDVECFRSPDLVVAFAVAALIRSAEMTGLVDFDDMLWLSVVHPVRFPRVDFLFIDEAQDLNPVQHMMAERLSDSGRTIAVADPFQSIYAFRGADPDSVSRLKVKLAAKTMPLTVTFRCPRSHVELARRYVPDFEAAPGAPEGVVEHADPGALDAALPGDLVLCRANAPLIGACLRQIARRNPAIVRGRSIGNSLMAVVRKLADPPTIAAFSRELARWKGREVERLEGKDGSEGRIEQVADQAAGLDAVASACGSPAEIPGAIARLFSDDDATNRVTFSSVHRAKGSEAGNVRFLRIPYGIKRDEEKPPQAWELQQRSNLSYVALTRSMDTLTLIDPDPKPSY